MKRTAKIILPFLVLLLILPTLAAAQEAVFLREEFENLDQWRPLSFPKIKEHTEYTIEEQAHESVLRTESHASASAIVYRKLFNVNDYPKLRWK